MARRVPKRVPVTQRILRATEQRETGCWIWTRARTEAGYGRIQVNGKSRYVHRIAYEAFIGPIPDGMQIDHLCHTEDADCPGGSACPHRACCNPAHLEPVAPLENTRRGRGHGSETHCPQGHPYAGDNLRMWKGRRVCRSCNRERSATWYRAHVKGEVAA